MTSCPDQNKDNALSSFDLSAATDKLDSSVVEQLVLAAVASLPTPKSAIRDTPSSTSASTPADLTLNFTEAQLEQINVAQAQAIAQATANYQHLFATLESTSNNQNNNNSNSNTNIKKDSNITQKVRQENRERKKRWRQQNQERNKDNDLRCRVNKRAHKLFGKEDSEHKQKWIADEFAKRRSKRKEKEDRKQSTQEQVDQVEALNGLLNDPAGYITLLANNLSSLTNATDQITTDSKDEGSIKSELLTNQLLEFLQQQQLQQHQQNEFDRVLNNTTEQAQPLENTMLMENVEMEEEQPTEVKDDPVNSEFAEKKEGSEAEQNVDYPMDAVLTLMQLNAGWRQ